MFTNRKAVDKAAIKSFAGMKVLVFGLGILGGGVAAANWLIRHKAKVTVTDLKPEAELTESLNRLEQPVSMRLGGHDEADIRHCDLVLFNPDIPVRSPYVALAHRLNRQVENEATLFYRLCRLPIIAVTGTRGKTTTCAWIEHLISGRFRAVPAGNSPDNPFMHTLQVIEDNALEWDGYQSEKPPIIVNELPSYHLEYFKKKERRPDVAVVTNIFQDHLNRHSSMQEYVDTKANVFRHQSAGQSLILNHGNPWTAFLETIAGPQQLAYFSMSTLPLDLAGIFHESGGLYFREDGRAIPKRVLDVQGFAGQRGTHNLENLMVSALAAKRAGLSWDEIQTGIATLPEITFRQEMVFQDHGLTVVNDNAATSPDGCMAAIERFGGKGCILIAGGTDRELDYTVWAECVKHRIQADHLVFLEGSATDKMLHELRDYVQSPTILTSLDDCFETALKRIKDLETAVIVFSPGAKSFEKFDNEFARGRVFNAVVDRLLRTDV
jgi:UDP-N-acetylmuramoylalanine--D-glutamate ligase